MSPYETYYKVLPEPYQVPLGLGYNDGVTRNQFITSVQAEAEAMSAKQEEAAQLLAVLGQKFQDSESTRCNYRNWVSDLVDLDSQSLKALACQLLTIVEQRSAVNEWQNLSVEEIRRRLTELD